MLSAVSLTVLCLCLPTFVCSLSSPLGPVVDLSYAAFAGNSTSPAGVANGPVTFYGAIPYAQPPLGNLRFRAPQPLDERASTKDVSDARNWGPPCIQRPAVVGIGSEDCLTLNVWKPSNASEGAKLPVVVYIHGGGFYYGTPQGFPMYDWVAQHPGGIIGVSITYRLGLLGYLGGPKVAADGALNAGLLDQRAGLEWVQRHISKFGGDPDNVTISGESAGGAAVMMQIVAYGGSVPVPFKRAIAQSIGFGPTVNETQVEINFNNAASFAGCSATNTMDCLRKASIGGLISAMNRTPNGAFAPIVEGPKGFLPDLPSKLITAGKFNPVEFIGGHCTGDGRSFAGGKPEQFNTEDDIRKIVFSRWPGVSNDTITQALTLYPAPETAGSPFATQYDRAATMAGDIIFSCMDSFFAQKSLDKGVKNVFAFSWNAPDTVLYNANPYLGAMHTSDLYYLFSGTNTFANAGNTFKAFNTSEAALSTEAIAYWTSFAASGNPSSAKKTTSPAWTPFAGNGTSSRTRLLLTRGGDVITSSVMEQISTAEIERCNFWMSASVVAQTGV
ncbi:alpha/beta-hydrolase [Crassisporium funariophilum]|nr:alpha/beta-hydrolase [Crassisporium funariophilum]